MNILALDTSGPNCSVAILSDQKVIANFNINIGKTHSETLLPLIDDILKFSNLTLDDIDVYACSVGPGSFTGIRIGIATIKGFAISANKPIVSVSSLESLAYNIPTFDGLICSILDAKNNNVYAGIYKINDSLEMIGDYYTDSINDLINDLKEETNNILFVGDGAISYKDILKNNLNEKAFFTPYHLNEQSSVSVAKAALNKFNRNEIETVDTLHPLYLKKSQAERMLEQNNKS